MSAPTRCKECGKTYYINAHKDAKFVMVGCPSCNDGKFDIKHKEDK